MTRGYTRRRAGTAAVEFAAVAPALILVLFGLVVGGLGIFRYHQVASLAREAARHASVRGMDYYRETGQPAATQESIRAHVLANAAGLDPEHLTCTVTWDRTNNPRQALPDGTVITNVVSVTVSYNWQSEAFFGSITLTSTSRMPMSY